MSVYFGIDYGSRFTGNTVIAILQEKDIFFLDVEKKVDADLFILNAADHFQPDWIFLDAPCSLPGIYRGLMGFENYHFRKADLECKAMSPMFLGGLAARAMELKSKLENKGIEVYETFPRIMARRLGLEQCGYKISKRDLGRCAAETVAKFQASLQIQAKDVKTWHHLDALLALMSAMSFELNQCKRYGHPREGQILV